MYKKLISNFHAFEILNNRRVKAYIRERSNDVFRFSTSHRVCPSKRHPLNENIFIFALRFDFFNIATFSFRNKPLAEFVQLAASSLAKYGQLSSIRRWLCRTDRRSWRGDFKFFTFPRLVKIVEINRQFRLPLTWLLEKPSRRDQTNDVRNGFGCRRSPFQFSSQRHLDE